MKELKYTVNSIVYAVERIIDDGGDCHPAYVLADKNDRLFIKTVLTESKNYDYAVSHDPNFEDHFYLQECEVTEVQPIVEDFPKKRLEFNPSSGASTTNGDQLSLLDVPSSGKV